MSSSSQPTNNPAPSTSAPSTSTSQPSTSAPSTSAPSTSQPALSTNTDTDTDDTSISALTKLSELLRFSNGNIDQATQLATLLSRLSPALLNNLSSAQIPNPNANKNTNTDTAQSQQASTSASTSTTGNSSAAAAASSAGVAVATSAPNSSATATVSPPSLLTQGSVSSSTAVPFSEVQGLPPGVCIDLGGHGNNAISTVRQSEGAVNGGGSVSGIGGGAPAAAKTSGIADLTQRASRALHEPMGQTRGVGAAANSAGSVRRS